MPDSEFAELVRRADEQQVHGVDAGAHVVQGAELHQRLAHDDADVVDRAGDRQRDESETTKLVESEKTTIASPKTMTDQNIFMPTLPPILRLTSSDMATAPTPAPSAAGRGERADLQYVLREDRQQRRHAAEAGRRKGRARSRRG